MTKQNYKDEKTAAANNKAIVAAALTAAQVELTSAAQLKLTGSYISGRTINFVVDGLHFVLTYAPVMSSGDKTYHRWSVKFRAQKGGKEFRRMGSVSNSLTGALASILSPALEPFEFMLSTQADGNFELAAGNGFKSQVMNRSFTYREGIATMTRIFLSGLRWEDTVGREGWKKWEYSSAQAA